ncbi:DUF5011 domain-containing protein, partial [Akkermansiaceae bacterium]|nr:DUF5011 domain-containing protein [Akkermansiaceae bacterium]MDC0306957.1 DUF5011 domain-containing protein [Akkermansiaceae bacterium]
MQLTAVQNSTFEVFKKDENRFSGKCGGILFVLKLILGLFPVLQRRGAFLALFACSFLPLYADEFVVSTLADDGNEGSFRSGIIAANGSSAIDTITFEQGVSGTITLTSDLPAITENLTITGPSGSESVTISGNDQYAMFSVSGKTLTLSDLTFTEIKSVSGENGSIITLAEANAVATGITVTGNTNGTAFFSKQSTLTISHSTFSDNSGLIFGSDHGSTPNFTETPSNNRIIVTDSTFESNSGVIFSTERYVMIDRCVFSSNTNTIGDFRGLNAYRVLNSVFTENQHSSSMPLFTFSSWSLGEGFGSFSSNHHLFDGNTFSGNNDENGQSGAPLIDVGNPARFGEVTTISNNTFAVDPSIASYGPVLYTLIKGASPNYGTNTTEIEYPPAPQITVKSRYSVDFDGPYPDYNISWSGNSIKIAETFGGSEAWSGELKYIGDSIYVVENATDSSYNDREFIFNSENSNGVYDQLIDNYYALYLYSAADAYDVNLFGPASSAPVAAPVEAGSYLLVNTVSGPNSYYDTVMVGFVDSTSPSLKSDDIDNDVGDYGTPQVWSTYGEIYDDYHYEMSALDVNVNDVPVDGYFRMIVSQYGYNSGGGAGDGPGDGPGDGSGGEGLSLVTYNQEQNEPPSPGYLDGLTLNFGVEVFEAETTELNVNPVDLTHQIVLDADQIKDYTIVDFKLNQDKTAVSEVRYNEGTWIHLIEVPLNADGTRIVWGAIANGDVHPSPNPNSFTAPEGYEIILDVSGSLEKEYNTNTNTITDLLQLLQNIGNIDGDAYAGLKYIGPDRGPNGSWGTYPGSYAWGAYAKSIDQTAPAAPTQNWPALTNDPTPTLTGTAEADSTVRIYHHGSEPLGSATADSESGSYSITVPNLSEGSHIITATATDAFGNVSASTMLAVVVDTTAPVITLLGSASPTTAEAGFQYIDAGATADGGESVDTSGTVNTSILGDYVLDYTAEDSAGNVGTATRTVNVKDTTKPVIALTGDAEVTILVGTPYQEPGATFSDNYDTELIVTIDSLVNKDVVGEYTVSYTVTDTSGYEGTAIRTVKVEDQTAPVVTLNGDAQVTIEMGGTYTELGATVSDNYDTTGLDVDVTVTPTEDVNTSAEGTYEITYSVTDVSGNTGTATRTVTVDDTIAPDAPTLNGPVLTKSTTPTLTGTAEPGSSVKFYDGGIYLGTTTDADSESGFYSIITASVLAEGSHDITAIAKDVAGNTS